jgi:hypothetical protein
VISAVLAILLALGGVVAEPTPLTFKITQFLTPVVKGEVCFSGNAEGIAILDKAVMDYGGFFLVNFVEKRRKQVSALISISPMVALRPKCYIGARLSGPQSPLLHRIKVHGGAFNYQNVPKNSKIVSGGLPAVYYVVRDPMIALNGLINSPWVNANIGPQLRFSAFSILSKVTQQSEQRTTRKQRLGDHCDEIPSRPISRVLLSDQVPLFAFIALVPIGVGLIFAGFGKFISNAIDSGRYWRWGIIGYLSVIVGAALAAIGITGLLGG